MAARFQDCDFSFKCLGDPGNYYSDSDETLQEKKARENDDDQIKFYTLDKLPGDVLMIGIKQGCMEYTMSIMSVTKEEIQKLVDAQLNDTEYSISVKPGSNQDAGIRTRSGYTYFAQFGAGGDSPTDSSLKIPNSRCVEEFKKLINY